MLDNDKVWDAHRGPGGGVTSPRMAPGDWLVCVRQVIPADPPAGSSHVVLSIMEGGYRIPWISRDWAMVADQVRPATPEEVSRAQLVSLEGL